MNKRLPLKIIQGGYSDIRLWPCYMLLSSLMLFLTPQIGVFRSTLVVLVPFIIVAKWVADSQPRDIFDHKSWKQDLDLAIDKGLALSDTAAYWSTEYKKHKFKQQKLVRVLQTTVKS